MLDRLNAHRAWANQLHVGWMGSLEAPEEYCLKMLSHVLRAEEVWLARLRGEVPENRIWTVVPPAGMDALLRANNAGWSDALAENSKDLARVLRYRLFDGREMESSVSDIVTHVCAHGTYHRGQIAAQAARAGLPKIPSTDFILFARL